MIVHRESPPQKPVRVVILGARGFIGAALKKRLGQAAINVLSLASADTDLALPASVETLVRALNSSDAVVMLATLTGRDNATLMKNLAMMQHVIAALERTDCAHLVYFSSDAVYGLGPARVTEETPAAPQDLYGVMHLARELMARALAKVPVLVFRPTLVYGAGDTHNAYGPNRFHRAAQKEGIIQLFGGGEETRDHIHVDDVAALTTRCLMHGSTGTLNLATGRSVCFRELAEMVARQFPKPVQIVETARAQPVTHRHYDVTNLIKAFPDFKFVALEDGLARCQEEVMGVT